MIEDGFDLAIRGGNIGDGAGLVTRTIGLQRMAICGAPTYLAKHGRPERLDGLLRHTGIVYGRAGHIRTWEFLAGERKALVEATPPSHNHEYELYLAVENIDHTRTKARSPQTNGICERFHKTLLDEF